MSHIYTKADQIDFTLDEISSMPLPTGLLMVEPTFFSIDYVINPHMEGNIGNVDKAKALTEWETIKKHYESFGLNVHPIAGQPGLPDMVFCANQSFPCLSPSGKKEVLMSIMHSPMRKQEVSFIEDWYQKNAYEVHHLDASQVTDFEGMGDAIWINGKRILFGGYGYRSSLSAYDVIREKFDIPVVAFELVTPKFYHLDTCFCSLNEDSVLIYPPAFKPEGVEIIKKLFKHVIEATEFEAEELFACNATCPDGKNVVIQRGCKEVNKQLSDLGFVVHEVETEEFLKSGGSVFCMKMMVW
ncbi:hypothetical protein EP331_03520 [bacterium]|nr:MAG: hypothetical protein EP331_03520 [bacterium]